MGEIHRIVERLGEQLARGEVVLFTGAGFSFGATDTQGTPIPQVKALTEEIWDLVWPGEVVPEDSALSDTYAAALAQKRNDLKQLMLRRLDVAPHSVTDQHRRWLSMPWRRAYTLNIDNLEAAAARQHSLPRKLRSISALDRTVPLETSDDLFFIHLNGALSDVPDVTFADPQYGARQTLTNPLYEKLAADLVAYPVVFVGSQLRESLFWQYVALRDARGTRGTSEMRPRSYLVTPDLPRDRQALLSTYNIEWVKATTDEFADEVLARLESEAARGHRTRRLTLSPPGDVTLPRVVELASLPAAPGSEYLMGASPLWGDITDGRAFERAFEALISFSEWSGCMVVTGTAGAGTSTVLMRLALRLAADGYDARWIDANHGFDARDLSRYLRSLEAPIALIIDDADTFGRALAELVDDVLQYRPDDILVIGMRGSRVDQMLPGWKPDGQAQREINVPLLDDADIEGLLDVLDRNHKLGALKPLTDEARRAEIRQQYGRELLIAMVEATSGKRFELKVAEEFDQLQNPQRLLYGIAALASELRFSLGRDELLVASGDISNPTLYAMDRLVARKLLVQRSDGYTVRHRRIAELVVAGMRRSVTLYEPYAGLLRAVAIRVDPSRRKSRETKLLTALLSHERVHRSFALDDARQLYDSVEEPLSGDYHFWLQRGSLEVANGNLPAARTYLQQAFAGGENDFRVKTEWAYYLIKSARSDPRASDAAARVEEGQQILLDEIDLRGTRDPYLYHVYGSQMLAWLRRASMDESERGRQLETIKNRVADGCCRHPYQRDLHDLYVDIENEWLSLAIPPTGSS